MSRMGKASVGSLLVLLLAGATLSDGEGARESEEEELPLEALKYLGRFGHLQPPNGPFSLVDRWVNNPDPQFPSTFVDVVKALISIYPSQRCKNIYHLHHNFQHQEISFSFETGLRSFQSWVGLNTSGTLDKYIFCCDDF